MTHLSDEDLVLHYYGELDAAPHLDSCPACRESWRRLQASLNLMSTYDAPEPHPQLATKVWHAIAPEIRPAAPRRVRPNWALGFAVPALAATLAVAFYLGRVSKDPDGVTGIAYLPQKQILRAHAAEHLERSKLVLLETVHSKDGHRDQDPERNRQRAEELLSTNRLLRRGAVASGQLRLAEALEELERILVEIAHAPEGAATDAVAAEAAAALRARIESQGTLFRLAVVENEIENKKKATEVTEE